VRDYSADSKEQAIALRRDGYSYSMISEMLGVPKSTLSGWLRDIEYTPNEEVITCIGRGRIKGGQTHRLRRIHRTARIHEEAKREIGDISKRDLWLAGIAMYWGEGNKSDEQVSITNSDPNLVRFMMRWFREICHVPEDRFRVEIHLYPDSDVKQAEQYWSEVTGLPLSQFYDARIDRRRNKMRKKKRSLPYGTVHIRILGGGPYCGRALHRRIMGWIEALHVMRG
jgi:hypothetical protein